MPLKNSPSKEALSQNIAKLLKEKYPKKQAIAIALENQRRAKKKKSK